MRPSGVGLHLSRPSEAYAAPNVASIPSYVYPSSLYVPASVLGAHRISKLALSPSMLPAVYRQHSFPLEHDASLGLLLRVILRTTLKSITCSRDLLTIYSPFQLLAYLRSFLRFLLSNEKAEKGQRCNRKVLGIRKASLSQSLSNLE